MDLFKYHVARNLNSVILLQITYVVQTVTSKEKMGAILGMVSVDANKKFLLKMNFYYFRQLLVRLGKLWSGH